jgi:hypothetical protein
MIEMMVYTLVGISLYICSDWILVQIEKAAGRKFDNRNMVFFAIIMVLALVSFALIRLLPPDF